MTDPQILEVRNATMLYLRVTLLREVEKTGWDASIRIENHPYLALEAVEALIKKVCV